MISPVRLSLCETAEPFVLPPVVQDRITPSPTSLRDALSNLAAPNTALEQDKKDLERINRVKFQSFLDPLKSGQLIKINGKEYRFDCVRWWGNKPVIYLQDHDKAIVVFSEIPGRKNIIEANGVIIDNGEIISSSK